MKRLLLALLAAALLPGPAPAAAEEVRGQPQGPAKIRFGKGFPALHDAEWKFRIGGFGGVKRKAPLKHVPVIFVHGNNVDHADWYPVRDAFRKAGWSDQELWGLSYNGLGGNNGSALHTPNPERDAEHREMGWDGTTRVTSNDVNVPDLYAFVRAVQAYTGTRKFSIVSHSLGVTVARKTLKTHRALRKDLAAFVAIAGPNDGTTFCPEGTQGQVASCDEIRAGSPWLAALNGPGGSDETFKPAKWLTVFDGTGYGDPAYVGPTYATSPELNGATNKAFPGTYHNDLRLDPAIVAYYRTFLTTAERGVRR